MSSDRQSTQHAAPARPGWVTDTPDQDRKIVGVPKYQQLADALREEIQTGAMPAGSLIPSDAELVGRYGVSQTTARHAIRALRDQGLVITYHGRGSFVRRQTGRPAHTYPRAVTLTSGNHHDDRPENGGSESWTELEEPARYRIDADADLALALGVPEHTPILLRDRLLAARDGRRITHRLFLPITVAADTPGLDTDAFRDPTDLYDTLATAHGRLHWTETVRARTPTPDDTNTLRLPDATPVLTIRRTTHHPDGHPLALEDTHLSAEDTQLTYTFGATRAPRRATR